MYNKDNDEIILIICILQKGNNMSGLYDNMTGLNKISKTLRFELIPEPDTLGYLEADEVLSSDQKRADDYLELKKLLDRYYRAYIEECFSDVELEGLDEYVELYNIANKTKEDSEKVEKCQEMLRKQIVAFLSSDEIFKSLFKADMVDKILPDFLNDEKEKELVESFHGFATMCTGFWENRRNVFSDEAKATAIAYRVIHENLPKFINNMNLFVKSVASVIDQKVDGRLLEKAGVTDISEVFSIDFFSKTLSQSGIETYNSILGGYSLEDKTKVQGVNELINLHNQNNKDKKVGLMQPLFKQILSDRNSASFIAEKFEADQEVLDAVSVLFNDYQVKIMDGAEGMASLIGKLETFDINNIFVKNDVKLTDLSNKVFGEWNRINNALYDEYDKLGLGTQKNKEKYEEAKKAYFKRMKSVSLGKIQELTSENITEKIVSILDEDINLINDAYESAKQLLSCDYPASRKLVNDESSVSLIKTLLDTMKTLESFLQLFMGDGSEPEKDDLFYGDYLRLASAFDILDMTYNKVRNYCTQKPYTTEKIKLTFDSPTLLNGWDLNKEESNKSVILRKDGYYYLGIMKKDQNKIFRDIEEATSGSYYEKMEYKLLPGPNKMLPKVFFSKKNIDYYAPDKELLDKYKKGTHKKGKDFDIKDCHALIDFFKESIEKHPDWSKFGFAFSNTSEYSDMSGFYKEVEEQGYNISFKKIHEDYIDKLVEEGKLYLFKIYNKDFSPYSKGRPNLHTMYWKALFDEENLKNVVYKLNGEAEVFYRKKSISEKDVITHKANEPIDNKNVDNEKKQSRFAYDIIKDRRYTVDKFQFHVPITMNFKADGRTRMNLEIRRAIKSFDNMHVIGIDRGERHLLYVSVIDMDGRIVEQYSLNEIINEYNGNKYVTDYHKLLDSKESGRTLARQEWKTIENIKELKDGYMSQVVHIISKLMVKYNAIVVLEDLNFGFKRGRQKVEKQVYQKFEKALIEKLNYLVFKDVEPGETCGLYKALQLTDKFDSFAKLGKQSGALFYVPAWNTSKMDPTTGFVNLLNTKYESIEKSRLFIERFKAISLIENGDLQYYAFDFDYNDFTEKAEGTRTEWTVCSYGTRIINVRNESGYWESKEIDLSKEFDRLFGEFGINSEGDLKEQICKITDAGFYKRLMKLIGHMFQIRNSETNSEVDYMISPVQNSDGRFFDTRESYDGKLPINADANGAYNIARKGLWIIEQIKNTPDDKLDSIKLAISNKEWMQFAQR